MRVLEGRVAVVTGAGRGIGRAEALRLAAEGAAVAVNDHDAGPVEEVAAEIRAQGGNATVHVGDVSDWRAGNELVERAITELGRLDVLVCNAGIARPKMIFNMSEEEWDTVTRIHLKGSFVPTRAAAIHWRAESKRTGTGVDAAVLFTTSGNGLDGVPGHINYVAAKAGLAGMTTTLAKELGPYGVRVNAIAPIAFTRMSEELHGGPMFTDDRREEWSPEQVAEVATWLVAPPSAPLTGQVVSFNGRHLAANRNWTAVTAAESTDLWTWSALDAARDRLFPPSA